MRAMLTARVTDSAPPTRALLPWLLAALALHLGVLWAPSAPWRPQAPWNARPDAPAQAPPLALQVRAAAPPPGPQAVPARPSAAPRANAAPAAAPPLAPVPAAAPDAAPTVQLPSATRWAYLLVHDGAEGEAWLDWQREGTAYALVLQRRTPQRALPRWESRGQVGAQGLAPQRFAVQRGRTGQRLIHDAGEHPSPQQQDRLSWMLQVPALLQARPEAQALVLTVIDWRGQPQDWQFERLGDEPLALPGGQTRDTQRWRRVPQGQAQAEIELWLDPTDGFRPLRLVHKVLGDERWELLWNPAATAPIPGASVINPPQPAADKAGEAPSF